MCILVAVCACVLPVPPGHTHPVLSFVEQTVTVAPEGSSEKPAAAEFPVTVTLGHTWAAFESKGVRQIYDFERRRMLSLHLESKTYEDYSLYAVFAFQVLELENRLRINKMMDAAKIERGTTPTVVLEHLFSLQASGQNADIQSARAGDTTVFRWKEQDLLTISNASKPLPAAYQAEYWRWLRYTLHGHPQIYAQLEQYKGVPELVKVEQWPTLSQSSTTLRLATIKNVADRPYSLEGFTLTTPQSEPFLTLRKLDVKAAAMQSASAEAARRERDTAASEGRMLDAVLASSLYTLVTGDNDASWTTPIRSKLTEDADARAYAAALPTTDLQHAESALQTLGNLRTRSSSPYSYVMDVFAANQQVLTQHPQDAEKLFLAALSANPYLTSAWYDLGNLYYVTFRTPEAWACWDAARRLRPEFPLGKSVSSTEQKMAADHPEFF